MNGSRLMGRTWETPGETQMFSDLDGLVRWGRVVLLLLAASIKFVGYLRLKLECCHCDLPVLQRIPNKYLLLPSLGHKVTSLSIWGEEWLKEHVQVWEPKWLQPPQPCGYSWIKSLSPAPPAPKHRGYWPLKLAKFPAFYIIQGSSAA